MSTPTSTNRQAVKEQSSLNVKALKDPKNVKALDQLLRLIEKCYGPYSKNIVLQNDQGGIVTASSNCQRLLNALPAENPLVRLLTTSSIGHCNNFSDAGLFTMLKALNLVKSGLKLEQHRHLITCMNELLLEECLLFLADESCSVKKKLDFGTTDDLLKLVLTIISSKPGTLLDKEERSMMSRMVLTLFISGISHEEVPDLHVQSVEGSRPGLSLLHDGFLYAAPEIWNDEITPLKANKVEGGGKIRTVLFAASMAGDSQDFIAGHYEMERGLSKEDVVLKQLEKWIESLVSLNVGILFCQKVVHERLKETLKQRGIIVMERLGTKGAKTVQRLTVGIMVHSAGSALRLSDCGHVLSVQHVILHDKSFLDVRGSTGSEVSTLLLCHYEEDALDELRSCCGQAYDVLRQCLSQPHVLHGGGCWITALAHHLQTQFIKKKSTWSSQLQCGPNQLAPIVHAFSRSLRALPLLLRRDDRAHFTDSLHHHHWMLAPGVADGIDEGGGRCVCGGVAWNEDVMTLVPFEELAAPGNNLNVKNCNIDDGLQKLEPASEQARKKVNTKLKMTSRYCRNMTEDTDNEESAVRLDQVDLFDSYTAFTQGLQTAVLTANMILSTSNIISDCN